MITKTAVSIKILILRAIGAYLVHKDASRLGKEIKSFVSDGQLDAMKEGARRAAVIAVCVNKYYHLPRANEICIDRHDAILTAAEQWTVENLN